MILQLNAYIEKANVAPHVDVRKPDVTSKTQTQKYKACLKNLFDCSTSADTRKCHFEKGSWHSPRQVSNMQRHVKMSKTVRSKNFNPLQGPCRGKRGKNMITLSKEFELCDEHLMMLGKRLIFIPPKSTILRIRLDQRPVTLRPGYSNSI